MECSQQNMKCRVAHTSILMKWQKWNVKKNIKNIVNLFAADIMFLSWDSYKEQVCYTATISLHF